MFIGKYELDGKDYFDIYYDGNDISLWNKRTFPPACENIETLDFTIKGKTYKERKEFLRNLAIEWQLHFSYLEWSYAEIAEITDYFYEKGKKCGLLKEFRENAIC